MSISTTAPGAAAARRRVGLIAACGVLLILAGCGDKAAAPAAQPTAAQPAAGAPPATAATAGATPPAAPAPVQLPVPELLKNATLAVAEERLVAPAGNNAIEYYLAVIAQEPNNVQATQALVDLFPMTASIAERAIEQKQLDEGERIVALLDQASPGSYTVSTIRSKLELARQGAQREEERKLAAEEAAKRAAEAAAAPAATAAATTPTPAVPAPPPAPAAAETEPEPEPEAPAETAPTQVAAAAPPPAQVAPPTPAAPAGGVTREAQLVKAVEPVYPTDAARKRLDGWVELQFTVDVDGKVTNVSVARSQPARVFDREAIRAMQQWTFTAAQRNGQPVESRRRQRMNFSFGG